MCYAVTPFWLCVSFSTVFCVRFPNEPRGRSPSLVLILRMLCRNRVLRAINSMSGSSVFDFVLKRRGQDFPLSQFRGHCLLIANVATN